MCDKRKVYRRVFGFLLIGLGTAGDLTAGFAILRHYIFLGLTLHLAATSVWIAGLMIDRIQHPAGTEAVGRNGRRFGQLATGYQITLIRLEEAHITLAIVLALCLFPGLGSLGFTAAFGLAYCLERQTQSAKNELTESVFPDLETKIRDVIQAPLHPLVELEVRPLAEILNKTDGYAKRAALDLMCQEGGPEALSLARGLLTDLDPEVRGLAAVAVSKLEAHFSELLKEAVADCEEQPQRAEGHATVGNLYRRYAYANAPGSMQRRFYLVQARQAFEKAVALDPMRRDDRVSLAGVLIEQDEGPKAWQMINQLLSRWPADSSAYLLGAEMAFKERRFNQVVALAERAGRVLAENDKALPILKWWLETKPVT